MTRPTAMAPDASTSPVGHTPGPHNVDGVNKTTEVGGFYLVWGGGELLAYVARRGDAKLYAAAPELLVALVDVVAALDASRGNGIYPDFKAWEIAARAAIAKAWGEVA